MNTKASMQRYTRAAVLLHWMVALLIIGAFALGLIMTDMPGLTPAKLKYYSWHKWAGVTVLLLAAVRLLWRLATRAPEYTEPLPEWQRWAAHATHGLLYLLMFAVPLSGYFYSLAAGVPVVFFGVVELPVLIDANADIKPALKAIHYWLNMLMAALVGMHVAAALKHQFIDGHPILRRMAP
jgi:cytochrome b561